MPPTFDAVAVLIRVRSYELVNLGSLVGDSLLCYILIRVDGDNQITTKRKQTFMLSYSRSVGNYIDCIAVVSVLHINRKLNPTRNRMAESFITNALRNLLLRMI